MWIEKWNKTKLWKEKKSKNKMKLRNGGWGCTRNSNNNRRRRHHHQRQRQHWRSHSHKIIYFNTFIFWTCKNGFRSESIRRCFIRIVLGHAQAHSHPFIHSLTRNEMKMCEYFMNRSKLLDSKPNILWRKADKTHSTKKKRFVCLSPSLLVSHSNELRGGELYQYFFE